MPLYSRDKPVYSASGKLHNNRVVFTEINIDADNIYSEYIFGLHEYFKEFQGWLLY